MRWGWLNPLVWFRAYCRQLDMYFLFDASIERGLSRRMALEMFAHHIAYDGAWRVPEWQLNAEERQIINEILNLLGVQYKLPIKRRAA